MKHLLLLLLLCVANRALPMIIESGSSVVIDHPVFEDLYLAGGTVTINARVHGDLIIAGGTVFINDTVDNEILVAGGRTTLSGYAGGTVRCISGDLRIARSIHGDLVLAGGTITIERGCTIDGSLLAAGSDLTVYGSVKGNIRSTAGRFHLFGSVGGDLDCRGATIEIDGNIAGNSLLAASQSLDIGANAAFRGAVRYWSAVPTEFGSALTNGKAIRDESLAIEKSHWYFLGSITWLGLLAWLGAGLVGILALQYFFADRLQKAGRRFSADTLRSLGGGLLFIVGVPALAILCFITLVGIPLAIALLSGYGLTWLFSSGLISVVIANSLDNRKGGTWGFWRMIGTAFGIFLLLKIVFLVPVAGMVLFLALAAISFGAILLDVKWRRPNSGPLRQA